MKTIEELYQEMASAANRNHSDFEQEVIDQVLLAAESGKSKRELLGLNKKRRQAPELPLFAEKKLF